MDLIERLRTFGAYAMDEDGNMSEFHPNALTTAAADEIERLRALCYEAQEFITHDKNCGALMGLAKDCSCGYDEMWRKLNV